MEKIVKKHKIQYKKELAISKTNLTKLIEIEYKLTPEIKQLL